MTLTIAAMPAYNESHVITEVILGCKKYVDKVIVVDDGSSDNTAEIAESVGGYVVRHEVNKGYGAALKSCFKLAREFHADAMVIIDSDGQHNPDEIPQLLEPLKDGADLVIGSRFIKGNGKNVPTYRKIGMKILDIATYFAGGIYVTDSQSGFRAYGKKAIENIWLKGDDMSAGSEILLYTRDHNLNFVEVEIHCRYDLEQCSSQNPFAHGLQVMLQILKDMEIRRPLYYFTIPGMMSTTAGLFMGTKFLQDFYSGESLSSGSTLLMILIMFVGIFMVFTGIILHAISKMIYQIVSIQKEIESQDNGF
ncbi:MULTISPECIES: glycosyltransferase family 2 protein [unclassified Methanosarcina]|uniref:glycosyltransferase family 2 protein n=1 Tax=unclassified Methanosarcina TaxID=2644672 RepID=UPI000615EF0D|nr:MULTISPECIES: glycosyltransferase family 2 protein [unclassified Methanosarcina]AKB19820.1 Dolichol-phosphate mannosyltransferase [Methanosarcina sp. WWM596]AKB22412.1 Dolichol-phosphate mannosyltransferase [Methanosarcina sp. WH1]